MGKKALYTNKYLAHMIKWTIHLQLSHGMSKMYSFSHCYIGNQQYARTHWWKSFYLLFVLLTRIISHLKTNQFNKSKNIFINKILLDFIRCNIQFSHKAFSIYLIFLPVRRIIFGEYNWYCCCCFCCNFHCFIEIRARPGCRRHIKNFIIL